MHRALMIGRILPPMLPGEIGAIIQVTLVVIVLAIPKRDFSLQELSRLIENSETRIRQFNTYWDEAEQLLQVTLKLNQFEISDVLNTLQHHDYPIKYYFGEELFVNELRSNFEHLMNYLNI